MTDLKVLMSRLRLTCATGIPASVYTGAVTQDVFSSLIDSQIDSAFNCINGNAPTIENTASEEELKVLKTSIEDFFEEYAKSIGYQKDEVYFQKIDSVKQDRKSRIYKCCFKAGKVF